MTRQDLWTNSQWGARVRQLLPFTAAAAFGLLAFAVDRQGFPLLSPEAPELTFGAALVVLAFVVLGGGPGLLAGFVAFGSDLLPFSAASPFAVLHLLEAWVVYRLFRRWRSVVLADAVFWLAGGWLLDIAISGLLLDVEIGNVTLLFVKQLFNGLINALIVESCLVLLYRLGWRSVVRSSASEPMKLFVFSRLVSIVVAPVVVFGLLYARAEFDHRVSSRQNELLTTASSAAARVEETVHEWQRQLAQSVRRIEELRHAGAAPEQEQALLAELRATIPELAAVRVASGPDRPLPSTGDDSRSRSIIYRAGQSAVQTRPAADSAAETARQGRPTLEVDLPIDSTLQSQLPEWLVARFAVGSLRQKLAVHRTDPSETLLLVDRDGRLLAAEGESEVDSAYLKALQGALAAPGLGSAAISFRPQPAEPAAGARYLPRHIHYAGTMQIAPTDLRIVVDLPVTALHSQLMYASFQIVALLGLVLGLSYLVMSSLARRLSGPLATLTSAAGAIAAGETAAAAVSLAQLANSDIEEQRELADHLERMRQAVVAKDVDWAERRRVAANATRLSALDIDLTTGRVQATGRASRIFGIEKTAAIADVLARVVPEDRQAVHEALEHIARSGEERELDFRIRAADGKVRSFEGRAAPTTLGIEGSDNILCVLLESTQRREAERAVRESEAKYRQLFESLPIGVALVTPDGEVLAVNETALRYGGWLPSDVRGRAVLRVYDDLFDRAEILQKLARDGKVRQERLRFRRKDGTTYVCSISLERVEIEGKSLVLAMTEDITERLELEEQLFRVQKIEAIGRLASGVAHDFNNLVTVILGSADLARRQLGERSPQAPLIEQIELAARKASALTRQLLSFSRRQNVEPQAVDLNLLTGNLERMLSRLIEENIELVFEPSPELWSCRLDPGQLEQVLFNFVINARDAMPEGGKITVRTRNVPKGEPLLAQIPGLVPGDYVCFEVEDHGRGMDQRVREQMFEPFFTTKAPGQGTGLGLSTCYSIINQAGGHIAVDTELGRGTRLTVYLPRAVNKAEPIDEPSQPEVQHGSERVLLVEDEPMLNEMAATILRQLGYRVLATTTGDDALELAEQLENLDLLVADVVLPTIGGVELADRIQEQRPDLRVLFVTGYANAKACAVDRKPNRALLAKPFTSAELAAAVRELLDRPGDLDTPTMQVAG